MKLNYYQIQKFFKENKTVVIFKKVEKSIIGDNSFYKFFNIFFIYKISLLQKQIDNRFNKCIDLNLQEKKLKKKEKEKKI